MQVELDDQEVTDIIVALKCLKNTYNPEIEPVGRISKLSDKLKLIRMGRRIFSK